MDLVYVKKNQELLVSPKFVYYSSIYKFWKEGASSCVLLIKEKYYASKTPIDLKKVSKKLKHKDYTIQRFIELKGAPEDYLISKGYKLKKNE